MAPGLWIRDMSLISLGPLAQWRRMPAAAQQASVGIDSFANSLEERYPPK